MRALALFAALLCAAPARAATIVSLGFDDNTSSHTTAANILSARGIRATFYVNTGRVGLPGFLSLSEVNAIAAQGHEIAGHTVNHQDVTTLTAAQRQQQICEDRAQLQTWGFNPVSFAYPFGAFNSSAETTVQSCGYTNARTVGGLLCSGCPAAETNPPADAFAIRTPNSVNSGTTLAQMQGWVTAAENAGGGIVPIVMHHVCDGCSELAISPAQLAAFADWLNARGPNTVARTMREALGAPPPAPPPASTTTVSLWTTQGPAANEYSTETAGLNLGTRFRSSSPGQITALKYYKPGPVGNGPKQGRLWNAATGALLGSVSFPATTTQGWHSVDLPAPVSIQAGVDYIVSYHTNSGYSTTRNYFVSPRLSPPLTGVQGHYLYSAAVAMPTSTTGNSNYWADVVWRSTGTTTPPPASTSCFTSNGTFQNRAIPAQTGTFSARFEATPGDGSIDGVAGFSNGAADALTDLAPIMRFNLQGLIDARNGGAYTSVSSVPYVGGQPYKFRLEVNVPARTYSAFVTTGFNPETQIANNYAFRSEQSGVAQLTNLGLVSTSGSETVCHLSVTPTTPPGPSPLASISVTPVSASITQGGFQEFRAVGTRVNGSTVALNEHWSTGPNLPVAKRDGLAFYNAGKLFVYGGQNASGALATGHSIVLGSTGPWVAMSPMPAPRYEMSGFLATSSEDVWVFGGFDASGNPTSTWFNYSAESDSWAVIPSGLPTPSACSQAARSGSRTFLLTGCDGTGNTARRLDMLDEGNVSGWTRGPDAPNPHASGVGTAFNGRFYVVGGQSSNGMHPQLDMFTPSLGPGDVPTGTWTTISTMPVALTEMEAAVLGGKWFIYGGRENGVTPSSRTWIYDFATNAWSQGPSAPFARFRAIGGATDTADKLYVVGGHSGTGETSNFQVFDPATRGVAWSASAPAIATVSVYGVATGLNQGSTQITASSAGVSGSASLTVMPAPNPVPVLGELSPRSARPGSASFTLTLRGNGFVASSVVRWNGQNRTTAFVSGSTLTATIPASDVAAVGVASVTVFNAAPGGGTSNVALFTVSNWAPTGSMSRGRMGLSATLLPDARVLVTGDMNAEADVPGELYNPAAGTWTQTADGAYPRYKSAAVRLPDGRVLIAGGWTVGECCLDTVEIFDPGTNQFEFTGAMTSPLSGPAFVLNDGRVLAVGNDSEDPFGSAQASIYNVAAGTWSAVAARSTTRRGAMIAKLNDGRVLVAGGQTPSGLAATAETWNPATGLWTAAASMPQGRYLATATTLPDGRVLVAGGATTLGTAGLETPVATSVLYNPATNTWAAGPAMSRPRLGHTATPRPDGTVLVAGSGDSQIFNPATNAWSAAEPMAESREGHAAVLLGSNRVLAVGPEASAEVYTVAVSSSGTTPPPAVSSTCVTSLNNFQNISMPAETGTFTARFDATPGDGSIDGVAGFSNGAADGYGDFGPIVRFNLGGTIDARNGGAYTAVAPVPYQGGVVHRFRLEVNVATHRYSAFVSTGTAPERAIAVNYAFRNEQSAVTQLTNLGVASTNGSETVCLYSSSTVTPPPPTPNPAPVIGSVSPSSATAGSGALTLTIDGSGFVSGSVARWNGANRATTFVSASRVTAAIPSSDLASPTTATVTVFNPAPGGGTSNGASFVVHAAPPPPPPPPASTACVTGGGFQNMPFAAQTGAFTAQFEATPSDGSIDGATGFSNGAIDSYGDLGPIVRFNLGGTIDARNGGSYQAVAPVPYTGGVAHRFRLEVDVPTRRYSAFVSVGGGAEQQIANNYAFRNEQASVTQLNNLGLGATGGTETVCSLSVTPPGGALSAMSASEEAQASGPSLLSCPTCPSPVVDLELRRAYPNPWRADQHSGLPMVFDRMPAGTVIEIYSVSGKPLKTITAAGGSASWDLSFEGGEKASSGYYLYRATTPTGVKKSGKIAIVR